MVFRLPQVPHLDNTYRPNLGAWPGHMHLVLRSQRSTSMRVYFLHELSTLFVSCSLRIAGVQALSIIHSLHMHAVRDCILLPRYLDYCANR